MNQYDKKMREWRAIRHMEDLFKQGMFSNMKFDNKSEEFNKMFHSSFPNRVTVEQEAVRKYIRSVYTGRYVDKVCECVPKTVDLSFETYNMYWSSFFVTHCSINN